jgi:hypothetical protein
LKVWALCHFFFFSFLYKKAGMQMTMSKKTRTGHRAKKKEPKYFSRLRELLASVYEIRRTERYAGVDDEFFRVMDPYGMKLAHITRPKLQKGVFIIPPPVYGEIVELPGEDFDCSIDELIGEHGIYGVHQTRQTEKQPGGKNSVTLTCFGHPHYVPRLKMVKDLEKLLKQYSPARPRRNRIRTSSSTDLVAAATPSTGGIQDLGRGGGERSVPTQTITRRVYPFARWKEWSRQYWLTIADIVNLPPDTEHEILILDRNVLDTAPTDGQGYPASVFFEHSKARLYRGPNQDRVGSSRIIFEEKEERVEPQQLHIAYKLENSRHSWYPLKEGVLPGHDSQSGRQMTGTGQEKSWEAFPDQTLLGWRGPMILWENVTHKSPRIKI